MRWKHIAELVNGNGQITIGRVGPFRCAAVAGDEDQQLAALVRNSRESFEDLLSRLDAAIRKVWEEDEFVDETQRVKAVYRDPCGSARRLTEGV